MSRISKLIPSFFNGVSQQDAALRLVTQCEEMDNIYPSIVTGCRSRPYLKHIKKIATSLNSAYTHMINRDANERYVVLIFDGSIKVFDMAGNEKTVTVNAGGATYLDCADPKTDFAVMTVADHTFIVNKTITVAKDTTETLEVAPYEGLVWIKKGVSTQTWYVNLQGVSYEVSSTDDASTYKTTNIAVSMKALIDAAFGTHGVACTIIEGSILKFTKTSDFSLYCTDSWGGMASICIKKSAQKYEDLPPAVWDGLRIKISDDGGENKLGYYVEYVGEANITGVWRESRGWSQYNKLNAATMPWELVRNVDGTFTFQKIAWEERFVGDDITAPMPSFVGHKINEMIFYRNRFGLISDENISFSRAGDFYNFFPETVLDVRDGDPIDVGVSHRKVSIIKHAVPFENSLLLYSDQTQFILSSSSLLTPSDVKIDVTTEYECSSLVTPVAAGSNLYFVTPMGNYSGIMEYFVAADGVTHDASNITAHVPTYVPKTVGMMISSATGELLAVHSSVTPNVLYIYKYYWVGDQKAQSAWSKWTLPTTCTILSGSIIDTTIYLVIQEADGVHIMSMDYQSGLEDTGFDYEIHLDKRCALTGVYNAGTDTTTWTLPYAEPITVFPTVVMGSAFTGRQGNAVSLTLRPDTTHITVLGNYSAGACYVGTPFNSRITLSEQFVKQDAEEKKSIIGGRLQLLDMQVYYSSAYQFDVEVTPENRTKSTYTMRGSLGTTYRTIGKPLVDSGAFRFPVLSRSNKVLIDIVFNSYIPAAVQSVEWSGNWVLHSDRQ